MKVAGYSHQGKRKYQEDSYGFTDELFIVCDGVGGSNGGDVASKVAVDHFINVDTFTSDLKTEETIQFEINQIKRKLEMVLKENPDFSGSTTMAMVYMANYTATLAHIGDSKILYRSVKNDSNNWATNDHTLVQDLFDGGHISESEMKKHPLRNRITRAISIRTEDVNSNVEIHQIEELERGDRFLLCSDGVLESWSKKELFELLSKNIDVENCIQIVRKGCEKSSSDNHTCIIVEIE
jgi:serine/threonine protein phosphatase PrpC